MSEKSIVEVKRDTISANNFRKTKAVGKVKMTPKRRQMINQTINALVSCNYNRGRASKMLNITEQALYSRFKKYPQIMQQVDYLNKMTIDLVKKEIEAFSPKGAKNIIKLANKAESENVKLNANLELLDRAGITKPSNTNVQVNILNDLRKDKNNYDL